MATKSNAGFARQKLNADSLIMPARLCEQLEVKALPANGACVERETLDPEMENEDLPQKAQRA